MSPHAVATLRSRGSKRSMPLTAYTIGCLTGGAGTGILVAGIAIWARGDTTNDGALRDGPRLVLSLVCGLYALDAAKLLRAYRPQSTWQVPVRWTGWPSRNLAALAYGSLLGVGFVTRIPSALYPVLVWIEMTATPVSCAFTLAIFGAFSVLPLWVIEFGCENGSQRDQIVAMFGDWEPAMSMASAFALVFSGAVLLSGAFYP
jgi:cytochrome c biogenesis protein CcdA